MRARVASKSKTTENRDYSSGVASALPLLVDGPLLMDSSIFLLEKLTPKRFPSLSRVW